MAPEKPPARAVGGVDAPALQSERKGEALQQVKQRSARTVRAILLQSFLGGLVFFQPFHALLLANSLGGAASAATSVICLTSILTAVLEVPSGVLADLWGRKHTLTAGTICLVMAHVSLYAATGWMVVEDGAATGTVPLVSWTPWLLLVLRALLQASAESLFSGTNDALLYDVLLEEEELVGSTALGRDERAAADVRFKELTAMHSMMWPLAAATASVTSGWMLSSELLPLRGVIGLTALPAVGAALCSLAMHEATPVGRGAATADTAKGEQPDWLGHTLSSIKTLTSTPSLRLLGVNSIGTVAFADSVHLINPMFFAAKGVPLGSLGVISFGMYGCSYLGSAAAPRASRWLGDKKALLVATAWMVLLNCVAAVSDGTTAAVALSLSSLSWGMRSPIHSALRNKHTPSSERATVSSIQNLLTRCALAVCVPLAGIVVDSWSADTAVFLSALGVGACGAVLLWLPASEANRKTSD